MNKRAIYSLLIAISLPLIGYMIVKYYSRDAVQMPKRYFYDSVHVIDRKGKKTNDTIWHKVRNIQLTNQMGKQVSLYDLRNKVVVVNFFFSRCPSICPGMTRAMKKLQDSYVKNPDIVHFLSISIDSERDSVPALRRFADRFNVNHDNWWFTTGDKKDIYDFAFSEMKASIADAEVDTAFIHTENLFLLDSNKIVRGWYNAFDSVKQAKLAHDIPTLMLEKDRTSPSIFRSFIPYLPVIFLGIGLTILMVNLLHKNKKKTKTYAGSNPPEKR